MSNQVEEINATTLPDVREIGEAFTKSVNYPGGFSFEAFSKVWGVAFQYNLGKIFCVRNTQGRVIALLGASFGEDPFSGWKVASESFWFVLPEARGTSAAMRLLDAFEAEAKERGSKKILMVRLEGEFAEVLDKVYQRRGYICVERTYAKEL